MIQKLVSFSFLLLLSVAAVAQNATLSGNVRDADTNSPLGDASVVVSGAGKIAATTSGGAYRIEALPAGDYTLVVTYSGYLPQEIRITARAGEELRTNVLLRRDPNAITTPTVTEIPTITLEEAEAGNRRLRRSGQPAQCQPRCVPANLRFWLGKFPLPRTRL
jgi:hypothetical protein